MKPIGLMGRVAVGFVVTTLLPILLFYLSFLKILRIGQGIFILIFAGLFFIAWIYNGIVKPVDELKNAAKRIGDGDLDFSLEAESHDEFGELTQAFEKMRIRLKQNQEEKVLFGGRLGEYKYYDMDMVIASALDFSQKQLG